MSAIFPVAYFGPVSYYRKLVREQDVELEVHEHYVKQSLRNRMYILGPNGIQPLSIPVEKPQGNKTPTGQVRICHRQNWQKIHWKAIESAYSSSPYLDHYGMEIRELIFSAEQNLVRFDLEIHRRIVRWLDLPVTVSLTEEYRKTTRDRDFRDQFQKTDYDGDYAYPQVFPLQEGFAGDLSILDALLNTGPLARNLLL